MDTVKYSVTGMTCAACQAHVEKAVRSVPGVSDVSVSLMTNSMTVTFSGSADDTAVVKAVTAAGYGASSANGAGKEKSKSKSFEDTETPAMKKRLAVSLILLIPLMYVSMGVMMWKWPDPLRFTENPLACALYQMIMTTAVMVVNQKFFISGFRGIVKRSPNMDTLVALGSSAAFVWSVSRLFEMTSCAMSGMNELVHHHMHELYFESAAMILTLITVGKTLEASSKGRAADALKSLMDLAPKTALVVRDGTEAVIPADEMMTGDIFIVKPGGSIPADGIVISGESAVDESALTGESIPVDKTAGSSVSAATVNRSGTVTCRATRVSGDTTLDKIIEMVENASATKAPAARIADRISGIFVPVVTCIALVTGAVWFLVCHDFGYSLARAISVLVISCPCALGLATPVAIMTGSGQAARHGILFKTAAALEAAGKTQIAVFDKTGTVTEGKPSVTDIIPENGFSEMQLMEAASAVESGSEHPLAGAVTRKGEEYNFEKKEVKNFRAMPGCGVSGVIDGINITGGSMKFMKEQGVLSEADEEAGQRLADAGKTPLYFSADGRLMGIIAVADTIRPESREAVEQLNRMGIETVMLTGDNRRTAEAVAKQAGFRHVISDVMPDEKEKALSILSGYGKTAMTGDGINDAPALTRADTGIAVGAGTDVAVEAADVVIVNSRLTDVCAAFRMSGKTLKNIHENLFWAFFYNCLGIPLAAGVFIPLFGLELSPMIGAAAMSLSSFCVVTNALRLNLFNPHMSGKDRAVRKRASLPDNIPDIIRGTAAADSPASESSDSAAGITRTLYIEGMMCEKCVAHVKNYLEGVDGVVSADVSLEEKRAVIHLDREVSGKVLKKVIKDGGYKPGKLE